MNRIEVEKKLSDTKLRMIIILQNSITMMHKSPKFSKRYKINYAKVQKISKVLKQLEEGKSIDELVVITENINKDLKELIQNEM